MKLVKEFVDFLNEYKIIALAIAFVMGFASTALVKSLVDNVFMPLITPFIPGGGWKTAVFSIGPISIGWGSFLAELINFIIIAFVVFIIVKKIIALGEEKKAKKK
jgi:large conductance mechanosensitive channel